MPSGSDQSSPDGKTKPWANVLNGVFRIGGGIVHDELADLMGGTAAEINIKGTPVISCRVSVQERPPSQASSQHAED